MANCKEKTQQWLKEMPTPKRTSFLWSQIQSPISPNEREYKTVFGFWIPHRGFRTPRTGLRILCQWNLDSGFQSLVGSGLLKPCSRWQSPGFRILQEKFPAFRIPQAEISRSPESGFPYMGRPIGANEILIQPKIQPHTLLTLILY